VKHRYYAGINDANTLMKPLVKLLDGKTDRSSISSTAFESDVRSLIAHTVSYQLKWYPLYLIAEEI